MNDSKTLNALYYAVVGHHTNTNEGLGRLIGLIVAFIVIVGTLFWAIG